MVARASDKGAFVIKDMCIQTMAGGCSAKVSKESRKEKERLAATIAAALEWIRVGPRRKLRHHRGAKQVGMGKDGFSDGASWRDMAVSSKAQV